MKFIKIHPNIQSALNPDEISLYISLLEQDYLMRGGATKGWSKAFLLKSSGLGRRKFDSAVDSMVDKGILEVRNRHISGARNQYVLVYQEIQAMNLVLDATNNKEYLTSLFKDTFKSKNKISILTKQNMDDIKQSNKKWKVTPVTKRTIEDTGSGYNLYSVDEKPVHNESTNVPAFEEKEPNQDHNVLAFLEKVDKKLDAVLDVLALHQKEIDTLKKRAHHVPALTKSEYTMYPSIDIDIEPSTSVCQKNEFFASSFFEKKEPKKHIGGSLSLKLKDDDVELKKVFGTGDVISNSNNNIKPLPEQNKNISNMSEETQKGISRIISYFSERYPEGSAEYIDKAHSFFNELKDDYIYDSSDYDNISFKGVFKNFITKDDKVFIFYNKVDERALEVSNKEVEEFNSLPIKNKLDKNVLDLPEHKKIEYIVERFRGVFEPHCRETIETINDWVKSAMVDLKTPILSDIKYNNPRLSVMLLENEIEPTDKDEPYIYQRVLASEKASTSINKVDISLPSTVQPKETGIVFSDKLDDNNIYHEIFEQFRITRRMNTDDLIEMAKHMLSFSVILSGDELTETDFSKLVWAMASKMNKNADELCTAMLGEVVDKSVDKYVIL